jgi:hypothetical protein
MTISMHHRILIASLFLPDAPVFPETDASAFDEEDENVQSARSAESPYGSGTFTPQDKGPDKQANPPSLIDVMVRYDSLYVARVSISRRNPDRMINVIFFCYLGPYRRKTWTTKSHYFQPRQSIRHARRGNFDQPFLIQLSHAAAVAADPVEHAARQHSPWIRKTHFACCRLPQTCSQSDVSSESR